MLRPLCLAFSIYAAEFADGCPLKGARWAAHVGYVSYLASPPTHHQNDLGSLPRCSYAIHIPDSIMMSALCHCRRRSASMMSSHVRPPKAICRGRRVRSLGGVCTASILGPGEGDGAPPKSQSWRSLGSWVPRSPDRQEKSAPCQDPLTAADRSLGQWHAEWSPLVTLRSDDKTRKTRGASTASFAARRGETQSKSSGRMRRRDRVWGGFWGMWVWVCVYGDDS